VALPAQGTVPSTSGLFHQPHLYNYPQVCLHLQLKSAINHSARQWLRAE